MVGGIGWKDPIGWKDGGVKWGSGHNPRKSEEEKATDEQVVGEMRNMPERNCGDDPVEQQEVRGRSIPPGAPELPGCGEEPGAQAADIGTDQGPGFGGPRAGEVPGLGDRADSLGLGWPPLRVLYAGDGDYDELWAAARRARDVGYASTAVEPVGDFYSRYCAARRAVEHSIEPDPRWSDELTDNDGRRALADHFVDTGTNPWTLSAAFPQIGGISGRRCGKTARQESPDQGSTEEGD